MHTRDKSIDKQPKKTKAYKLKQYIYIYMKNKSYF